jgi:hypothetical protein
VKDPRASHRYSDSIHALTRQPSFDLPPDDLGRLLKAIFGTMSHFFGAFNALFSQITDHTIPSEDRVSDAGACLRGGVDVPVPFGRKELDQAAVEHRPVSRDFPGPVRGRYHSPWRHSQRRLQTERS